MPELQVSFGGRSTAGIKAVNEDAFAALQPSAYLTRTKGAVAVVADGVSSSEEAQQASHTAVTQFVDDYLATPATWTIKRSAARVLNGLNSWFYHHSRENASMLTTFSALVLRSTSAYIFHAGDCRISRWRDGMLQILTREHRAGHDAYLTRALGMEPRLEVDYLDEETLSGDVYILTSDGVHDAVDLEDLSDQLAAAGDLEEIASAITQHAIDNGSEDNITCLLVRINQLGEESLDEAHRRLTRQVIPPAFDIDAKIDGYRVQRILHSGARSHLYLVEDSSSGEQLVMKVPSENFSEDPDYLERFLQEEWIGLQLSHPGIVHFVKRQEGSSFLYVLMQHVSGRSLRQWMHDNPKPPLQEVRRIVSELAAALRALQRRQMVHQDLKPENVMIDDDGRVVIIDLGTVHVAGLAAQVDSTPVGSVGYVAPESLRGELPTHMADIFALGVITYELLTGELPYPTPLSARDPDSYSSQKYRSLTRRRDDIPAWVDMTIAKAVSWEATSRYMALSEFLHDLAEPSTAMMQRIEKAPLMERNPIVFWRAVGGVLFVLLIISLAS